MTITVNDVSVTSYICEMLFNDVELAKGSCFFYKFGQNAFLVTNWHNLSGRNPVTEQPISATAAIPNHIRVLLPLKGKLGFSKWVKFNLTINNSNLWLEHELKNKVDVACLEVDIGPDVEPLFVNELKTDKYFQLSVADDLYIVGYPRGLTVAETLPIWKRASLASEPLIDVDELPKYYVDTATREGMSGSPVFARSNYVRGSFQISGDPQIDNRPFSINYLYNFIGIYSGRIGDDTFLAQIGIVWKARVIEEIIKKGSIRI